MAYTYITNRTTPNRYVGSLHPTTITIHWWGEPKHHRSGNIAGVVDWLCQARAKASAHFVVSGITKQIACLASMRDATWHSGNGTGNLTSVGIEMHPFDNATPKAQREADLDAAAYIVALIWHWCPQTKNKALKGHRDWYSTECPGDYYKHLGEIRRRAQLLYHRIDPGKPGQLKGSGPSKPQPERKDWFTMATKKELEEVLRDVVPGIVRKEVDRRLGDVIDAPERFASEENPDWTLASFVRQIDSDVSKALDSVRTIENRVGKIQAPDRFNEDGDNTWTIAGFSRQIDADNQRILANQTDKS